MSVPAAGEWSVGQAALAVDDLDAAVAFYRDILGVPFIAQAGPNLAFFDCGGLRLMLSAGAGAGCGVHAVFQGCRYRPPMRRVA